MDSSMDSSMDSLMNLLTDHNHVNKIYDLLTDDNYMNKIYDYAWMVTTTKKEDWKYADTLDKDLNTSSHIKLVDENNKPIKYEHQIIMDKDIKVGFIITIHYPTTDTIEIQYIYVLKEHRRNKYAENTIKKLLNKNHKRYIVRTNEIELIKLLDKLKFKVAKIIDVLNNKTLLFEFKN